MTRGYALHITTSTESLQPNFFDCFQPSSWSIFRGSLVKRGFILFVFWLKLYHESFTSRYKEGIPTSTTFRFLSWQVEKHLKSLGTKKPDDI